MQPAFNDTAKAKIAKIAAKATADLGGTPAPLADADKGKVFEVRFDLTIVKKQTAGAVVKVRAACQVDDKRMVAVGLAEVHPEGLKVGDTKTEQAFPFGIPNTFPKVPSKCEVVVMTGPPLGDGGKPLHTFCFTPGKDIREGACTWPSP